MEAKFGQNWGEIWANLDNIEAKFGQID